MFLSIITPTYNRGCSRFLRELCHSIALAKQYSNLDLEHIIVNDGSTDITERVILGLQDEFPYIRYLKNTENQGITVAKNYALHEAKGEFIADIDDDDLVPFYALGLRAKLLLENEHNWLCGNGIQITEEGRLNFRENLLISGIENKWECLRAFYEGKLFAYAGTRLYRKSVLERIGGWNERIHSLCEDFDLWLRLIYYYGAPIFCEIPLIYWRQKSASLGIDAVKSGAYFDAISQIKLWYKDLYEEAVRKSVLEPL